MRERREREGERRRERETTETLYPSCLSIRLSILNIMDFLSAILFLWKIVPILSLNVSVL